MSNRVYMVETCTDDPDMLTLYLEEGSTREYSSSLRQRLKDEGFLIVAEEMRLVEDGLATAKFKIRHDNRKATIDQIVNTHK